MTDTKERHTGVTGVTEVPEPEDPWHDYHRQGDITLRSNCGTLFKADKWRLSKASVFFEDMFEVARPPLDFHWIDKKAVSESRCLSRGSDSCSASASATPSASGLDSGLDAWSEPSETQKSPAVIFDEQIIDMDAASITLDLFLNFVNVSNPWDYKPRTEVLSCSDVLQLCEKLLCRDDIVSSVRDRLYELGKSEPWDLLQLASDRDDVEMGRQALMYMGDVSQFAIVPSKFDRIPRYFWTELRMLRPTWQAELLYLTFGDPHQIPARGRGVYPCCQMRTIGLPVNRDAPSKWAQFSPKPY